MLESAYSLLTLATIALAALAVGRLFVRGLGLDPTDATARVTWPLAVGLLVWGQALALLGLCGLLEARLIAVLTWSAAVWELTRWPARWQAGRAWRSMARPSAEDQEQTAVRRWAGVLAAAAALLVGGSTLATALAPPTAGDALCYHLELPKRFLQAGAIVFLPDSDNATFPLLVEMLYGWALALDGGVAAQLVHWLLGLVLAGATVELARPVAGARLGGLAAVLVLLVPGVNNQMTAPLNDVALAAYTTLALAAWWRGVEGEEHAGWLVVAGLMLGGALATKYVAILFAGAVGGVWIWRACREPHRRRGLTAGAGACLVVAVSVAGVWYLRAAWHRGNPVYPFFSDIVGIEGPPALGDHKTPLGRGPAAVLAAPWHLTMRPEQFGGRAHQLGPLWVALLPAVLLVPRLRGLGALLGVAGLVLVGGCLLRQNVRFLFPLVPPASVGVVWVMAQAGRLPVWPRRVVTAVVAGMLIMQLAIPLYRSRSAWAVAVGVESRQDYLLRREPTYALAECANALLAPSASILSQEQRAFYFRPSVTRESVYRRRTDYAERVDDARKLAPLLRAGGFTHLLLAEGEGGGVRYDETLSRLVATAQAEGDTSFVCLEEYRFVDGDGGSRSYRLMLVR